MPGRPTTNVPTVRKPVSRHHPIASAIRDRIEAEEERIREEQESLVPPAGFEVREGMEVVIRRSGRRGTVVRRDKAGRWVVETETLRLSLLAGELSPAGQGSASELPPPRVSYSTQSPIDLPAFELHLRGMRVEEALRALERQIDSALVHGLKEFSVIHGKGDGSLQLGMHFLPDVYVTCEQCGGARYSRETLDIRYKGRNIAEVLALTVDEALEFFRIVPGIQR
jgi:dsDNA-specific endonuclease/ATPase MutS2